MDNSAWAQITSMLVQEFSDIPDAGEATRIVLRLTLAALLGGLLGKVGGGLLRGVGQQAVSTGMSFATTYALGHVAKRYYAGGRRMNTDVLRSTYQGLLGPARDMQTQYLPQIQQKASTLDAGQIMALVKGRGL